MVPTNEQSWYNGATSMQPLSGANPYASTSSVGGGWSSFLGGVTDTVGGLIDVATQYEQYRQTRGGNNAQENINQPTTDYNPNITQNGGNTAPVGKDGMTIDNKTLMIGGGVLLGVVGLVLLLRK